LKRRPWGRRDSNQESHFSELAVPAWWILDTRNGTNGLWGWSSTVP
jgi:hypothetical protein